MHKQAVDTMHKPQPRGRPLTRDRPLIPPPMRMGFAPSSCRLCASFRAILHLSTVSPPLGHVRALRLGAARAAAAARCHSALRHPALLRGQGDWRAAASRAHAMPLARAPVLFRVVDGPADAPDGRDGATGYATPYHALLTPHYSPLTSHHAPRTTHHAPRTTHHAPCTTHHAPLTNYSTPRTSLLPTWFT
jgi:hypothetical protein